MIFRQLQDKESGTFTYLLADSKTKKAILIDPVLENFERDSQLLKELHLELVYTLETHIHADHVTSSGLFRQKLKSKVVVGKATELACADILLADGEVLALDSLKIKTIATPGHTAGCTTFFVNDRLFTGDALMIRSCGRTDFQQGSAEQLFNSIRTKLFSYPDETLIYPGHDYKGWVCTSVGEEKEHNPRIGLQKSKEEFIQIMNNLNLPPPKKLDEAVPKNLNCGL